MLFAYEALSTFSNLTNLSTDTSYISSFDSWPRYSLEISDCTGYKIDNAVWKADEMEAYYVFRCTPSWISGLFKFPPPGTQITVMAKQDLHNNNIIKESFKI
ncbi:1166_t:CDS:2 [Diversispora eburnea]|uniref:1166_t:CDS:1 n=1 Tax=Diversispora eburnea TaxID=1213867 RepID=A0A9N9EWZ8_9GLOM|nr:1166_t:CDS:2 [Diversispora eburnea]